jgi:hypothetical protein
MGEGGLRNWKFFSQSCAGHLGVRGDALEHLETARVGEGFADAVELIVIHCELSS